MANRRQPDSRKEDHWRRILANWQRSGQTVRVFCAQHGLLEQSFYAWRRIIAQRDQEAGQLHQQQGNNTAEAAKPPRFVPVHVTPPAVTNVSSRLEIVLPGGRTVRVAVGFDPATLRQLLVLLQEMP
jgi:transposase-like protein